MLFYRLCFLLILILSTFVSCNKNNSDNSSVTETDINKNTGSDPEIDFFISTFDFGTIIEGEKVSYIFKYKNTGGTDLIISDADASCGCTVPKWDKRPLSPGDTSKIEIIFDSSGRLGKQNKSISVKSNSKRNTHILRITAEVIEQK